MTTTRLKTLAGKVGIVCRYGAKMGYEHQDEWQQRCNGYRCTIKYQGRRYSFDFWQGVAFTDDPTAEGCLDCLLSDAQAGEQSFEEFCSEWGYDEDSRKAERTHGACQRVAREMRRLLGDDFETFLYAERD
jgi:hypothetical protein